MCHSASGNVFETCAGAVVSARAGRHAHSGMVVKNVAAADAKVAPGFEGGEPLTLANSRGLKSALKFFVKIGLFLEFRRIPGKLGDGGGADAKRYVLLFLLFCLFFLESLTLAIASKAWRGLTGAIGQQAALILLGAALLGATTLLEPPEVPVRGIGEWSD